MYPSRSSEVLPRGVPRASPQTAPRLLKTSVVPYSSQSNTSHNLFYARFERSKSFKTLRSVSVEYKTARRIAETPLFSPVPDRTSTTQCKRLNKWVMAHLLLGWIQRSPPQRILRCRHHQSPRVPRNIGRVYLVLLWHRITVSTPLLPCQYYSSIVLARIICASK